MVQPSSSSRAGSLRPIAPFDFRKSLDFVCGFEPTAAEQHTEADRLVKALRVGGHTVVIDLTAAGTVDAPALRFRVHADGALPPDVRRRALGQMSFCLGLEEDLAEFYRLGRADPAFAPVIERLYGYHQVKFASPFENACWAVLSQRCPIPVARVMKDRLTERYGGRLVVDGRAHAAFPEPQDLAAASPDELAACLRHPVKARRLAAVTAAFGGVDPRFLREAPEEEVRAWLERIEGIGPWSASFILVRGLGRCATVEGMEESLLPAAARLYGAGMDRARLRQIASRYGRWQGYWAHYLRVGA